jgi:hypothetical protein
MSHEEKTLEGYKYLVTKEDRCGGRPTIRGTRLEPYSVHLMGKNYLTKIIGEEAYEECQLYLERRVLELNKSQ